MAGDSARFAGTDNQRLRFERQAMKLATAHFQTALEEQLLANQAEVLNRLQDQRDTALARQQRDAVPAGLGLCGTSCSFELRSFFR